MRQLTKYWRQKGIRIVLYIDDRLDGAGTFNRALTVSQQVKSDLISCGFTPNQKSVWIPNQELIWLGHVLNFREAPITVNQEKILKLRACSHEPGTVNYPGVMIAPGQALPRVHMMICCPGAVNFIAPGQVHRHLITTNLSDFL